MIKRVAVWSVEGKTKKRRRKSIDREGVGRNEAEMSKRRRKMFHEVAKNLFKRRWMISQERGGMREGEGVDICALIFRDKHAVWRIHLESWVEVMVMWATCGPTEKKSKRRYEKAKLMEKGKEEMGTDWREGER